MSAPATLIAAPRGLPVRRSHSRTRPPAEPAATTRESGERAKVWAWSEAGTRSRCSPERASQATTVAQHAEATRTRPSRVNASSPTLPGDRLDVHAGVRAQRADLDRRLGRLLALVLDREQPAVGRERHRVDRCREAQPAHDRARADVADRDGARVAAGREPPAVGREGHRLRRRPVARGEVRDAAPGAQVDQRHGAVAAARRHHVAPRSDHVAGIGAAPTLSGRRRRTGARPAASPPGPRRSWCRRTGCPTRARGGPARRRPAAGRAIVPYVSTMSPAATSHTVVVSVAATTIRFPSPV